MRREAGGFLREESCTPLDVERIGVPAEATPAYLGFTMASHILGRAVLTATAEVSGLTTPSSLQPWSKR